MLPRTILVPIDFSDTAEVALDYAVELASRLDAKIHLFHAIGGFGGDVQIVVLPVVMDELRVSALAKADKLVSTRAGKAPFAPVRIQVGDARAEIEAEARRIGADLIVMGTHGRRGLRRLLLGSVAESIVRIAPCPVLLVRGPS